MTRIILSIALAAGLAWAARPAGAEEAAPEAAPVALESEHAKLSYAIGIQFATSLKRDGVELDLATVAQAMDDVLAGRPLAMDDAEVAHVLGNLGQELQAKRQAALQAQAHEHQATGDTFRTQHAAREGVTVLPSGLQYRVIQAGSGPTPMADATVRVHYQGTLIDGTVFDSSYRRGQPVHFPLSGVIPGWREGLQLMPVGAKWELVIPPNLGYGAQGAGGGAIPPNATLVFEVELLEIMPTAPTSQPMAPTSQPMQ